MAGETGNRHKGRLSRHWRWWGKRTPNQRLLVICALIAACASLLSPVVARLISSPASAQSEAIPSAGSTGSAVGRTDVSTLVPGVRFYARPDFSAFPTCGRPCWLPLYRQPVETPSGLVTQGWPCEYYSSRSVSSCAYPPHRPESEVWDPNNKNSADRVLIICQVYGQPIKNDDAQVSAIWDLVALPKSEAVVSSGSSASLLPVHGMPGFYESYAPDMWLGNTGWHHIACH